MTQLKLIDDKLRMAETREHEVDYLRERVKRLEAVLLETAEELDRMRAQLEIAHDGRMRMLGLVCRD